MRIRFLKGWNGIVAGQVADLTSGVADALIRRGVAEPEAKAQSVASDKAVKAVPANKSKPKRK